MKLWEDRISGSQTQPSTAQEFVPGWFISDVHERLLYRADGRHQLPFAYKCTVSSSPEWKQEEQYMEYLWDG
jgi:hypothetical protein